MDGLITTGPETAVKNALLAVKVPFPMIPDPELNTRLSFGLLFGTLKVTPLLIVVTWLNVAFAEKMTRRDEVAVNGIAEENTAVFMKVIGFGLKVKARVLEIVYVPTKVIVPAKLALKVVVSAENVKRGVNVDAALICTFGLVTETAVVAF